MIALCAFRTITKTDFSDFPGCKNHFRILSDKQSQELVDES